MVNLRAIANRYTSAINPNLTVGWRRYSGYTTLPGGKTVPAWAASVPLVAQVQSLTKSDVKHLDAMNLSRCDRAAFCNVQIGVVDRVTQEGGDLLIFEDGVWLATAILQGWTTAGWCKVALTKQNDKVI